MAIDFDDDILQDFLVEAGEIIEQLGEQLVELENSPDDYDLLNSIFRGFHTVKGGAGFLAIDALVSMCHKAEDIFNLLRQGDLKVTPLLMDSILKVHDQLAVMFASLNDGSEPEAAGEELLAALTRFLDPDLQLSESNTSTDIQSDETAADVSSENVTTKEETVSDDGLITDDEFENLLDELHGVIPNTDNSLSDGVVKDASDGDITEEEFESLLDDLHGTGAPGPGSGNNANVITSDADNNSKVANETVDTAITDETTGKNGIEDKRPGNDNKSAAVEKKSPANKESTVRVDTSRLDEIMNLVGELVLVRNRLQTLHGSVQSEEVSNVASSLDLVTSDLQVAVMKTRMQPIKKVFGRFPRVVRDLARSLDKKIILEMIGEETDLDKNLVEALADPLVHLVRNSVDHGIEMPADRLASGKDEQGTIKLSAEQEGDHILLKISDDGAGMDAQKLIKIAVDKGTIDKEAGARMSDKEAFNLIFMPGFSTKDEISDISGRGVGMDVVRTKINQLNGSIEIDSTPGKGTVIQIKVPLTLAIMPTLMIDVSDQIFALPLVNVVEIFSLDLKNTSKVDGREVIIIRDKVLPIYYLSNWLVRAAKCDDAAEHHVVVINSGGQIIGFVVDKLLGQEEVVIKPLGRGLSGTVGIAGATITGNGRISLILDVPGLLQRYAMAC